MMILYEGVEIAASFIEMFLLYKIYEVILRKYKRGVTSIQELIIIIIGTCLIRFCNHIAFFSLVNMLIFVLYTSVSAMFIYKTNYVVLFSITSFYMLCISCFDFLFFTLVSNFFGGYEAFLHMVSVPNIYRMVILIIIKSFWILIYCSMKKYLYKFSVNKKNIYSFLLIAVAGFMGAIYLIDQTFKSFKQSMTGVWLTFVVLFSLLFFVVYFILESREERMKLDFAEMRNNLLEENYKSINEIYMKNAKLYHDLNNHLNVLYQLLNQEKTAEAKEYIKEISKPITQLSKTIWTGLDVVDVIINSKLEKMREKGINADVNVEFPDHTNILPHDMCTILSNLLDNAIEAIDKIKGSGEISLVIRKINHFLLIRVSNDTTKKSIKLADLPSTSKENKELHGWGMSSVRDAVQKYNGTLKWSNSDGKFVVTAMLFYENK